MSKGLREGDFVYVRMEYRRDIAGTNSVQCYVRNPATFGFHSVPIPRDQIVCLEPKMMEVDEHGIVHGLPPLKE